MDHLHLIWHKRRTKRKDLSFRSGEIPMVAVVGARGTGQRLDYKWLWESPDSNNPAKDPTHILCFPSGSDGKESACNVGDSGWIPGLGRSPGEGMATHSSILAWRIPWTEEPGGLQSIGSQRCGHNWSHLARSMHKQLIHAHTHPLQCHPFLEYINKTHRENQKFLSSTGCIGHFFRKEFKGT